MVPGGVPAPPEGAGRQSQGRGTGHGAHTLPAAEQEEPFMEKESGEGMGRGGRKLKAEPKQKVWKEGMELGKAGAQRGGGAAGGQMWASPSQPTRFCGAVPGLCSERWGKAPAAPAPLGWVRLPQPGVLGVHGDPSVAPTRSASSPCRWGSDSSFALRQDWVPALLVQPGKKPGHKWDLIEVPIPQLTRSR